MHRTRGAGASALAAFLAGSLGLAAVAGAEAQAPESGVLRLDLERSQVRFVLRATLHTVRGSFDLSAGEIAFDLARGSASGRIALDAASGSTDNGPRDRNMRRNVLDAEHHPQIVFTPTSIRLGERGSDEARVLLAGRVDLAGASEPLEIPARIRRDGDDVRVEGAVSVPYVAWGLPDPSLLVLRVSPEVEVRIDAVGRIDPAPAAGPPAPAP